MLIIAHIGNIETELSTHAPDAQNRGTRHVFLYCEKEKLLNIIMMFDDFPETKIFHSHSIFPSFALKVTRFGANDLARLDSTTHARSARFQHTHNARSSISMIFYIRDGISGGISELQKCHTQLPNTGNTG